MTHFPARSDAFVLRDGRFHEKSTMRVCTGCGRDFAVARPWQRQCSLSCRQRAYVQRKITRLIGYYGARCLSDQPLLPTHSNCSFLLNR
jgi:hypothetical protein